MPREFATIRFEDLGPRSGSGFCSMPNGQRVKIDDDVFDAWHYHGLETHDLHVRRDEGYEPDTWKDWVAEPEKPLRLRDE